jgi:hypothetical protein
MLHAQNKFLSTQVVAGRCKGRAQGGTVVSSAHTFPVLAVSEEARDGRRQDGTKAEAFDLHRHRSRSTRRRGTPCLQSTGTPTRGTWPDSTPRFNSQQRSPTSLPSTMTTTVLIAAATVGWTTPPSTATGARLARPAFEFLLQFN